MSIDFRFDGPEEGAIFAFAHGAGAGFDSLFMEGMTSLLAARGLRVARFEFPYMAARREGKKSGAPDRQPVLEAAWCEVVAQLGSDIVIGGKSLGGRIATHVADETGVCGVVCFGYPFHPPAKPQTLRTRHLQEIRTPVLILQGTRDPFGNEQEADAYHVSPNVQLEWISDGDHSLKPRMRSGMTEAENLGRAADLAAAFVREKVRMRTVVRV